MSPELLKKLHADTVAHEAGHACAALLSGLRVGGVYAPPLPDVLPDDLDQPAGRTEVEWKKGDRRVQAIVLLAGPLSERRDAPPWPIRARRYSHDERQLAPLVNEEDPLVYAEIVADAERLIASGEFVRMHAVVGELLSHEPHELSEEQLQGVKSVVSTTKRAMPTYGRTTFPAEIKSLEPEDDTRDPWRSKALDNLGADLYEALTGPAMRKALTTLPQIRVATFDD